MSTQLMRSGSALLAAVGSSAALAGTPAPVTYQFVPTADTTIFSDVLGENLGWDDVSDAQGDSLWLSTTAGGVLRRTLVRFDLRAIPAGAQVLSASLTLYESRARDAHDVALHRLVAAWGEGRSNGGAQGHGASATAGDATWRWRDYQVAEWTRRGGDFVAQASASIPVGLPNASYTWQSTPGLVSDVQAWLDDPADNHGWILIGAEIDAQNAKRFDSLQGSRPPRLEVQIAPVPEAASLAMMAAGLLVLPWLRRLRQPGA